MLRNKRRYWGLFLCACILFTSSAFAFDDAILAIVNNEVITVKDLQDYMKGVFAQLKIEGQDENEARAVIAKYQEKGIEQLIDDRLVLSAADEMGIMIRPKAIDEKLEEIQSRYPSYEAFINSILKEGMSVTDVRKRIEDQFKGQFVIEKEVRSKIKVNPQEVTAYFNEHRKEYSYKPRVYLQSIFVKTMFGKEAAKKKIDAAMADLKQGRPFREVSAQYSELPSVGDIAEEDIRPDLKLQIQKLGIGETSDIIDVTDGYYIFKLEGRTEGKIPTLDDVKDEIYQKIFEEKFRERYRAWIAELREKAYIEIKK